MRPSDKGRTITLVGFNPRTRKGCDKDYVKSDINLMGFNPRTRKGCDLVCREVFGKWTVSIHAPVKDATRYAPDKIRNVPVSIHAPVKDATLRFLDIRYRKQVSIHAPVKDATTVKFKPGKFLLVSIHAPVKDATGKIHRLSGHQRRFNPRTRKGCDKHGTKQTDPPPGFNPRTRKGCDVHLFP